MPALEKPDSHLTTVKWRFPSVHPEGRKFTLIAAFFTLVAFWAFPDMIGWLMVGLTAWVAAFFRDPVRTTPVDPKLVVAPADGLVTMISRVPAPVELAADGMSGEFTRVSIFMSVFDVHINRSPVAGTIRRIAYIPGKFLNADLDKASETMSASISWSSAKTGRRSPSPRSRVLSRGGSCRSLLKATG